MKKFVYDRNEIKDYKEFYEKIYADFEGSTIPDWNKFEYLDYDADNFNEFLWYCHQDNFHIIFKNFDLEKIAISETEKNYENYQWKLIFEVCWEIVKKFPNNKVEFINDEN